jgi:hypothetical protein
MQADVLKATRWILQIFFAKSQKMPRTSFLWIRWIVVQLKYGIFSLASNSLCFWFPQWRIFFHSSTSVFKWSENIPDRRSGSSCHKCICMDIRNRRLSVDGSVCMSFTHEGLNYSQLLTHGNVRQTTWHVRNFGCKKYLMYEEGH